MDLYDRLLEMVIEDEFDSIQESVLSRAGLKKEDLKDPEKVKKAITNLNGITAEYEKRSAAISILTAILQTINSLLVLFGKGTMEGKLASILSTLVISVVSEGAKYHFGVSDYRKLINKIDTQIKRATDQIVKLNKSDNPDKEAIKQLEEVRENLRKSKDEILKKMKSENRVEGKDEKINPEPQNPIAAFTGMLT